MPTEDGSIPAITHSPVAIDAASQKPDLARQLISARSGQDGGIIAQLSANPFFTAGFGLAGLGAIAAFAQKSLRRGASLFRQRMLVDVEINIKDDSYPWFLQWMTLHQRSGLASGTRNTGNLPRPYSDKPGIGEFLLRKLTPGLRHLSIQTEKVVLPNGAMHTHFALIPGPGKHLLRYGKAFILVNRVREAKARDLATGNPWETVTLTTLYSHRQVFEDLFKEAHSMAAKSTEGKTVIYNAWGQEWRPFGKPRRKRPLESVILDAGVKERVVGDIQDFITSGRWYYDRGIPYRRGYLLHGPPGTGKSSFIQALAGDLDYDIAMLNLSERGLTDDRLHHLLCNVPARTLILLEDIDVAFGNRRNHTTAADHRDEQDGYRGPIVTFSGLLNALDGVASAEERIMFLTTNYVDRLDDALVRPGRVDMTVRLGPATRYQVERLWDRFYGELEDNAHFQDIFCDTLAELGVISGPAGRPPKPGRSTSTAALQGLFLYNKGNMQGAVSMAPLLVKDHNQVERGSKAGQQ